MLLMILEVSTFTEAIIPIFFQGSLDIHGQIIDQTPVDQYLQYIGVRSVGVNLDEISHPFERFQKIVQVLLDRRFSAGYGNRIQLSPSLIQKREHFLFRNEGTVLAGINQFRIVTVGAAKIAPLRKNSGADLPRIIDER